MLILVCKLCGRERIGTKEKKISSKQFNCKQWECSACYTNRKNKAFREKYPEQQAWRNFKSRLKRDFSMIPEDYLKMFKKQEGVCATCKKSETKINSKSKKVQSLSIDHCHKTGKIRGLLCNRCNITLGKVEDNPTILQNMLDYLNNS